MRATTFARVLIRLLLLLLIVIGIDRELIALFVVVGIIPSFIVLARLKPAFR